MIQNQVPIEESIIDNYELEYKWGKVKIKGTVRKSKIGNREIHRLSVGITTLGTFEWSERDTQGKTSLAHNSKTIGKGNLLAGILLIYAFKQAREETPFTLKEFFPDLFPTEN